MKNEDKLRPTPGGVKGEMSTEAYDKEKEEAKHPKKPSFMEQTKNSLGYALASHTEKREARMKERAAEHMKDRGYSEHR